MSQRAILKRYSLILEKLESNSFPSKKQLQDHLEAHGLQDSERTIDRDLGALRNEFGLSIPFDRKQRGYTYLPEENDHLANVFLRFLEVARTAELLESSFKEGQESINHLSFEYSASLRGIDQLGSLLKAVKEHNSIQFIHENFQRETKEEKLLHPYMLKEFQGRWYIIGTLEDQQTIRTYGIDRITNLKVLPKKFNPDPSLKIQENFHHIIGLVYNGGEVEKVVLHVDAEQEPYFRTLPLHSSQVLFPKGDHYRLTLDVIPNFELRQKLMMHHPRIKVLEPQSLVDQIKEELAVSLGLYS